MDKSKIYVNENRPRNMRVCLSINTLLLANVSFNKACEQIAPAESLSVPRIKEIYSNYVERLLIEDLRPSEDKKLIMKGGDK